MILFILFIVLVLILSFIIIKIPQKNYSKYGGEINQIGYTDKEKEVISSIKSFSFNPYNDLINLIEYRNIKNDKNNLPQIFLTHRCYFRKFLISHVFVLSHFYKKNAVILYIGASNSIFLPYLISLFPSFTWHI